MARLRQRKNGFVIMLFLAATTVASPAQLFTTLLNFGGTNGADPAYMSLIQGADGAFYGTTQIGGNRNDCVRVGCGTAFRITSRGALTTVRFANGGGLNPIPGLIFGTDGNFYGTTKDGGDNEVGTVFKITPTGTVTTLHSFCAETNCTDGASPLAALIQGSDGNFYGTTFTGGTGTPGGGTVFEITPNGAFATVYSFCAQSNCADGSEPYAGLVQGAEGNFYGTTSAGGNDNCVTGCGTAFRLTPGGVLTTVHTFDASDGSKPIGVLTLGADGNFYGTTNLGGSLSCDPPYGCGTVFEMTPAGTLATLHSFDGTDGAGPTATLVMATDGNLYGATTGIENGTVVEDGTVFSITPTGTLTTLHNFNGTDGADPSGGLLQATRGKFYGTTAYGGNKCGRPDGCGTVFSLDMGLGPFVAFMRGYGKVGRTFDILGQGFAGTTSVMLNGTPATFRVKSDTLLVATVPPGATTGYVTVTTPSGTLTSNVPFHVVQ